MTNHLIVVLDAHADAVEHDGDKNGALDVSTLHESLDTSSHPRQLTSCISSSSSQCYYQVRYQKFEE